MSKFDNSVATIKLIVEGCQSNITNIHRVVILSTAINQAELLLYVSGSFNKKYPHIFNLFEVEFVQGFNTMDGSPYLN